MTHGYLLDMDGVLYRGAQPIEHALEFIERLQQREIPFLLLTNHSCHTPQGFADKLEKIGLQIPPDHIYSSALATAQWLKTEGADNVFALGEEGLTAALAECGITTHTGEVSHVVVGLDRTLSYEKLKQASRLIAAGATFVATNPDATYPVEDGDAPECGLLLGALQTVTGREPLMVGKPSRIIYEQAAQRLGLPLSALTMIGDRLDTDIAGALGVGARAMLVLTGHTTREMLDGSLIQPDVVVESLRSLEL